MVMSKSTSVYRTGDLKRDDTVLICWKFSVCTKDCLWLHFVGFLRLVPLPILEVTKPRFWRITVHWIWGVSSSQSESLIDGTAYHSMWLTLQASMRSRMVSILCEEIRWASSWTDWSVWPYGLTCFWGSSGTGAAAPGKLICNFLMFTFRAFARPQVVSRRNEDQSYERQQKVVERSAMFVVLKLHSRHGDNRSSYTEACKYLHRKRQRPPLAIQAVKNMLFTPQTKQPTL